MALMELLAGVMLCTAAGGCADLTELELPPLAVTITTTGECVRVGFEITGASSVTGTYPGANCPTVGLIVAKPGNMTWDGSTRTLTIPTMVRNTTTQTVQLPLRLELPADGKTVVTPSGQPRSKLVPLNMDSTLQYDRKLWLIGGTGTLAPGDSTPARNLTFRIDAPVTKGRFWFVSQGEEIVADTTKPVIPTVWQYPAQPLIIQSGVNASFQNFRNIFTVIFDDTTSGQTINQFVADFDGTVFGGSAQDTPNPVYYILVPDPGPTWAAVDSVRAAMQARPGVLAAGILSYLEPIKLRGRFPTDSQPRSAWFGSGHASLRPWLRIRAPLAWGCENGSYAAAAVRVGMIDNRMEAILPDLAGSLTAQRIFKPTNLIAWQPPSGYAGYNHGLSVAGVLTATGDNGQGIAGMAWRTELYAWPMQTDVGGNTMNASTLREVLAKAVSGAIANSVRILNLSAVTGNVRDSTDLADAFLELRRYLDSGSDRLVVLAAGNNARNKTLNALATTIDTAFTAVDRAAAQLAQLSQYQNRIVFVTATDQTGARWPNGNVLTSGPMIAAPGAQITLLDGFSPQGVHLLRVDDGTSYAAPMVSGLAALLWSMDPTLTAAQVKDYIFRGAQQPRVDTATGQSVTPSDIGVAGIFQIDAYSSLKLLASERTGVPICGSEVGTDLSGALKVVRSPTMLETIAPAGVVALAPSVAQGGRLVAAIGSNGTDPIAKYFALQNGTWQQRTATSAPGVVSVQFLEKDTAIVQLNTLGTWSSGGPLRLTIAGNAAVQNLDLGAAAGQSNGVFATGNGAGVSVSPDGSWAAFVTRSLNPSGLFTFRVYVDSLGPPAPALIQSWAQVPCDPAVTGLCPDNFQASDAWWSHDGRWVTTLARTVDDYCDLVAFSGCGQLYHTRYHRFTTATGAIGQVLATDTWTSGVILSGDDATWRECDSSPLGAVTTKTRVPSTLAQVSSVAGCTLPVGFGTISNAPAFASHRP